MQTNRACAGIHAPLVPNPDGPGLVIDRASRAFHEDIAFGQALLVELAARLEVAAPAITKTYNWALNYHGGFPAGAAAGLTADWPEAASRTTRGLPPQVP